MAESSAFPKPREANDVGYQRISGFAVAGFAVGVLFVLFLLMQVVMGLLSHSTVLLPLWFEFIAVIGACLSLVGARSIRHSDGTLAGSRIAKLGIWISLISGLVYGSYYAAIYLAVRQQADATVREWFDKLRKGKINEAFLLTQQGGVGRRVNPEDEREMNLRFNTPTPSAKGGAPKPGALDVFRNNEVINMLKQGGEATKITSLGVRSWEHREGAYVVKRVYLVETPEGSFDIQMSAVRKDGGDAAERGRSWYVPFFESSVDKETLKKNKLGQRLEQMRASGSEFLDTWGKFAVAGQRGVAFLKTIEPKEQSAIEQNIDIRWYANGLGALVDGDRGPFANAMAASAPTDLYSLKQGSLPAFNETFNKGGLLDFSKFTGDDKAARDAVEEGLRNMLAPKGTGYVPAAVIARSSTVKRLWSVDAEKKVLLPLDCQIAVGHPGQIANYFADGVAWLQSEPGDLESDKTPRWRLMKLEIIRAADINELKNIGRPGAERFN